MKKREFIGLKLLDAALAREPGCLPDHSLMLLLDRQKVPHDECLNRPSALAPSVGSSRDHRGVVRRPSK